ncbi:MAG: tetratricopeptide repeat protein [Spirochaetes bacterium]|nr:tetratricopeptide repeat protein [Spirochaetota bacterium]
MKKIMPWLMIVFMASALTLAAQTAEDLYVNASKAFDEKAYALAANQYVRLITMFPLSAAADKAHYYLSVSYYHLGEYEKTIRYLGIFLKQYPLSPLRGKAYYWLAQSYYKKKDLPLARDNYRTVVEQYPDDDYAPLCAYSIGYIFFEQKRYEEAIFEFKTVLTRYPKSAITSEVMLRLGIAYNANGQDPEGTAMLTRLYTAAQGRYRSLAAYYLARNHMTMGRNTNAMNFFREAVSEPSEILENATGYLVTLSLDAKDIAGAYAYAKRFINTTPVTPSMYIAYLYIRTLIARGEGREAAAYYDTIKHLPMSYRPEIFAEFVRYYYAANDLVNGERFMQSLAGEHATNTLAETLTAVGTLYRTSGSFSNAAVFYSRASVFSNADTYGPARYGLGIALAGLGRTNDAVSELRASLNLLKDKWPAFFFLTGILIDDGRTNDALMLIGAGEKYDGYAEHKTDVLELKSYVFLEMKDYEKAKAAARELTATDYADRAYYRLGVIAYNEKDYEGSRAHFATVVTKYPSSVKYLQSLKELAEVCYRLKRYADARGYFLSYAAARTKGSAGDYAYGLMRAAWCDFSLSDYTASAKRFREAADAYKEGEQFFQAHMLVAKSHYNARAYKEAIEQYRWLIKQLENLKLHGDILLDACYDLGGAYTISGRDEDAERVWQLMLTRFPGNKYADEVMMKLADTHLQKKRYDASAGYYDALIARQSPRYAEEARYRKGDALVAAGSYKDAMKVLKDYIDDYPKGQFVRDAYYKLAVAYHRTEFTAEAVANYRKALALAPAADASAETRAAKIAIADILYDTKQFGEWLPYVKSVIDDASLSGEEKTPILLELGTYFEDIDPAVSATYYQRIADHEANPKAAEAAMFSLARIYFKAKDYAKAQQYLKRYYTAFSEAGEHRVDAVFFLACTSYYGGDMETAKKYFRYIVTTHPTSTRAELSKNILAEMLDEDNKTSRSSILDTRSFEIR